MGFWKETELHFLNQSLLSNLKIIIRKIFKILKSNFLADPRQTSNVKIIKFCENEKKRQMAKAILHQLLQSYSNEIETDPSYRIGLSGPPGAGKSTFIENMGPDSQKTKRQKLSMKVLATRWR